MNHSLYKGHPIEMERARDIDGFQRTNCWILLRGEWRLGSIEALDEETIWRDLDYFIATSQIPCGWDRRKLRECVASALLTIAFIALIIWLVWFKQ